jgi:hypothetical protein
MGSTGTGAQKHGIRRRLFLASAAATVGTASMVLFSAGVAAASPDMSGKSFSEAQAALKQAGYTAVAATKIGDKTAQSDCKVIGQRDLTGGPPASWLTSQTVTGVFIGGDQPTLYPGPGYGNIPTTGQVMLTLACYSSGDAGSAHPTGTGDINTKKAAH